MNDHLCCIVMSQENHHLGVVCAEHFGHERRMELDILVIASLFDEHGSTWILALPETMDNVDLDEMADVFVEGAHKEVDIVEKIELPTFSDERITQDVLESDCVDIGFWRQVSDPSQLYWRPDDLRIG